MIISKEIFCSLKTHVNIYKNKFGCIGNDLAPIFAKRSLEQGTCLPLLGDFCSYSLGLPIQRINIDVSLVAQQVKDPVLSLLWLWSLLWCRFDP